MEGKVNKILQSAKGRIIAIGGTRPTGRHKFELLQGWMTTELDDYRVERLQSWMTTELSDYRVKQLQS